MALNSTNLTQNLQSIFDIESNLFQGWPESIDEAAIKWSYALYTYASTVTPLSTTAIDARSSFESIFRTIPSINNISGISRAIQAYATTLAIGMLPNFTGIVNPVGPNFDSIATFGLNGGSAKSCIDLLVNLTNIYFRSCTAVNTSTGVIVFWQ